MANLRNELKSRHASLRRLHDDLRDSSFARRDWNTEVRARRTLGSDDTDRTLVSRRAFSDRRGATGTGCSIVSAVTSVNPTTRFRRRGLS